MRTYHRVLHGRMVDCLTPGSLTPLTGQVADMAAAGHNDTQIGEALGISPRQARDIRVAGDIPAGARRGRPRA